MKAFIHITHPQCSHSDPNCLLILAIMLFIFIIIVTFSDMSSPWVVSISRHISTIAFCCLCNATFATLEFVAANTFSGRFFDEKYCQKVCQKCAYSIRLQRLDGFACIFFTSLSVGVVAGKRSLESGGNIAV